jgi:prephenate dehydrogenase
LKVAVIGASGGMGGFFARYLLEKGHDVVGADLVGAKAGRRGAVRMLSNKEAVRGCDLVVLAVPMAATLKVAREVARSVKRGATIMEISSVKGGTLPAVRKAVGKRARLISIHPLFGPALESTNGMKVAVITTGGENGEDASFVRELFPDARIIPMTKKDHDRHMAVVLSLTHLMNLVYAGTVSRFISPEEFRRVSTPNSSMQLTLSEAVLGQDVGLMYAIQESNPFSAKVAREAMRELKRLLEVVEGADERSFADLHRKLTRSFKTDKRASSAMREVYSAAEKAR